MTPNAANLRLPQGPLRQVFWYPRLPFRATSAASKSHLLLRCHWEPQERIENPGRNREFGERMEHFGREKRILGEKREMWENMEDCGRAQRIVGRHRELWKRELQKRRYCGRDQKIHLLLFYHLCHRVHTHCTHIPSQSVWVMCLPPKPRHRGSFLTIHFPAPQTPPAGTTHSGFPRPYLALWHSHWEL